MSVPGLRPARGGVPAQADGALVQRIAAGETAALRFVYERWAGSLLALALRILRSRSEAEDVVQETFVEIWRRAPSYQAQRGSPLAWASAMVRSRAIDRLRARGTADRAAESFSREAASSTSPDVEGGAERTRLQAALATLPAEQRRVLDAAYFEGLTQREIAERSGEPLGTVKTRVRLALQKLSGLLGEKP